MNDARLHTGHHFHFFLLFIYLPLFILLSGHGSLSSITHTLPIFCAVLKLPRCAIHLALVLPFPCSFAYSTNDISILSPFPRIGLWCIAP